MSVKLNGRPISNPFLAALAVIVVVFGIVVAAFAMVFAIILMILCLPLHPLFILFGRKGIIRDGCSSLIFDKTSFERVN